MFIYLSMIATIHSLNQGSKECLYEILSKKEIALDTAQFLICCPHVARSFRPGQFIMLKPTQRQPSASPFLCDGLLGGGTGQSRLWL